MTGGYPNKIPELWFGFIEAGASWVPYVGRGRGGDSSGQPEVFANMRAREDIPRALIEKMLWDNPRTLYGH